MARSKLITMQTALKNIRNDNNILEFIDPGGSRKGFL